MDEVAIVVGGTGTIGAAIATQLQQGFKTVVVADMDERPVALGQILVSCDVTVPESVKALFEAAAAHGRISALVVAHGILLETPAGSTNSADMAKIVEVNLNGVMHLCDLAAGYLADGASILLLSSVTSFMGRVQGGYVYQATKAGVESLTHSFAIAYGSRGIRVNCIAPGFMAKPMKGMGAELRSRQGGSEKVAATTPLGRLVTEQELAKAAAFLCSPDASGITGTVLPVDAGQRAY